MLQPSEDDLAKKDIYTILAEMMHKEASKTKKQDALKNDLQKARSQPWPRYTCP